MIEELFGQFIRRIEQLTGMAPPVSHRSHIRRELEKLFTRRGLRPEQFLDSVDHDPDSLQLLMNIATINETYFFREERQFDLLRQMILPELFAGKSSLLLWSVSCSSGEEAVSLAALTMEAAEGRSGRNFLVYATDINTDVLEILQKGEYGSNAFRRDGTPFHDLLNKHGRSTPQGGFVLDDSLKSKIISRQLNLYSDNYDFLPAGVDVLFFRNTLLYMSMEKRHRIIERLADALAPGGYFFLASSEVAFVHADKLESLESDGIYFFRKKHPAMNFRERQKPAMPVRGAESRPAFLHEQQLFDALSGTSGNGQVDESADKVRLVLLHINRSDFAEARSLLDELKAGWPGSALILFLEGWLARTAGETEASISFFLRAFHLRPEFWPARFYYALTLTDTRPAAAEQEFHRCLKYLEENNNMIKKEYVFLLDGFDPAYFVRMCRQWLSKLGEKRGAYSGTRRILWR